MKWEAKILYAREKGWFIPAARKRRSRLHRCDDLTSYYHAAKNAKAEAFAGAIYPYLRCPCEANREEAEPVALPAQPAPDNDDGEEDGDGEYDPANMDSEGEDGGDWENRQEESEEESECDSELDEGETEGLFEDGKFYDGGEDDEL